MGAVPGPRAGYSRIGSPPSHYSRPRECGPARRSHRRPPEILAPPIQAGALAKLSPKLIPTNAGPLGSHRPRSALWGLSAGTSVAGVQLAAFFFGSNAFGSCEPGCPVGNASRYIPRCRSFRESFPKADPGNASGYIPRCPGRYRPIGVIRFGNFARAGLGDRS